MTDKDKKFHGLYVEVKNKPGDSPEQQLVHLEQALKKFKQMVKKSNLMLDVQKTLEFTKPSEKKKDRKNRSIARRRSDARRRERGEL